MQTLGKEFKNPIERINYLNDNCDKVEEKGYMKKYTPEEIQAMKEELAETSIKINDLATEKKNFMANLKIRMNPLAEIKGKNPGTVADFWDIPTKQNNTKHYASYNDSLIAKPILAGCPKGGLIYDPFMGSGSTAEAAIRAGRNFIGSEMGTEYCNIANERIHPFLLQTQLF